MNRNTVHFVPGKEYYRTIRRNVAAALVVLFCAGWSVRSVPIFAATAPQYAISLLLVAVTVAVAAALLRQAHATLKLLEQFLNKLPVPVAIMDPNMVSCCENQAAAGTIPHDFYQTNPLFKEIPRGYAITRKAVCRTEINGLEYTMTLVPTFRKKDITGYIVVFQNIHELVGNWKTRSEIMGEISSRLGALNGITAEFSNSTAALARCTQQQAELLCKMAAVVHGVITTGALEGDALQELQKTVSGIQQCIEEGSLRTEEISHAAGEIISAGYNLSNLMKCMKNITR